MAENYRTDKRHQSRKLKELQTGFKTKQNRDFPGGAVVKNTPANARDAGLSPGPGRSHMPWSD